MKFKKFVSKSYNFSSFSKISYEVKDHFTVSTGQRPTWEEVEETIHKEN